MRNLRRSYPTSVLLLLGACGGPELSEAPPEVLQEAQATPEEEAHVEAQHEREDIMRICAFSLESESPMDDGADAEAHEDEVFDRLAGFADSWTPASALGRALLEDVASVSHGTPDRLRNEHAAYDDFACPLVEELEREGRRLRTPRHAFGVGGYGGREAEVIRGPVQVLEGSSEQALRAQRLLRRVGFAFCWGQTAAPTCRSGVLPVRFTLTHAGEFRAESTPDPTMEDVAHCIRANAARIHVPNLAEEGTPLRFEVHVTFADLIRDPGHQMNYENPCRSTDVVAPSL